jgi:hypothetical protein
MSDPYCLISPCRDEAAYMERTLASVTGQTVKPALWVIVDDGSTDETPRILARYAREHDFIRVVRNDDRGRRSVGPGVIEAFYQGYATIDPRRFEYVGKLDMDLDLPPRYFETLIERMRGDARLGTCSGKPYFLHPRTGRPVSERCGDEMSVGMTKFYRRACFEQIGGLARHVMWDGIDCHRSRMLGWKARSWDEPRLRFIHLRPMGSSEGGIFRGRMRHGRGQHYMGTGPAYMAASALFRMLHPPLLLGGIAMGVGYLKAAITRQARFEDAPFRHFLRQYQWACLLHGKQKATQMLEARCERRWRPPAFAAAP